MSSISSIILPIYQKYAPRLSHGGGSLDLSVKDPSLSVKNPKTSEKIIEDFIKFCLKNTKKAHLIISGTDKYLIIKEENTFLTPDFKEILMGKEGIKVSSRIGFGTKIQLPLL